MALASVVTGCPLCFSAREIVSVGEAYLEKPGAILVLLPPL